MRIGIYGGTFDPIHFGHLHAIAYAIENANLDICHVVVAGEPWQKPNVLVDAKTRFKWVQESVKEYFVYNKNIIVDDREIKREGKTYSIDTINELANEYPKSDLVLIVGDDIPENLGSWKDAHLIKDKCEIFVVPKTIMPISSTFVRNLANKGKTILGLVPKNVESQILEEKLYI